LKLRIITLIFLILLILALAYRAYANGFDFATFSYSNENSETIIEETKVIIPPPKKVNFLAVGDIMLGRNVGKRLEANPEGFEYAFKLVKNILTKGDIVFANFEAPATLSEKGLDKRYKIVLKCKPVAVETIKNAGFNLVSIANNHILDYYDTGLIDTIKLLDANGIKHSGAGNNLAEARKPAIIEIDGTVFGLISFTDMAYTYSGSPNLNIKAAENRAGVVAREYETIKQDILAIKDSVDILAVSLHWGVEESFTITPEQIEFAHKLLDDGADIILGHHPHQFQGIEIYKGKPIFYSLGNFIFDQNDPENMESFIVNMEYTEKILTGLTATPVRILDKSYVKRQIGESAMNILNRQVKLCEQLNTSCEIENYKLIFNLQ
jgi:poly-gamma-glutamate capsule biosynthesis protein CapA/YwtB (metallophosphatase superfamily)